MLCACNAASGPIIMESVGADMAIKRQPLSPLFRIMQGGGEAMRLRAKNTGAAKVEARKHTSVSRARNPELRYTLERFIAGEWQVIGSIE